MTQRRHSKGGLRSIRAAVVLAFALFGAGAGGCVGEEAEACWAACHDNATCIAVTPACADEPLNQAAQQASAASGAARPGDSAQPFALR